MDLITRTETWDFNHGVRIVNRRVLSLSEVLYDLVVVYLFDRWMRGVTELIHVTDGMIVLRRTNGSGKVAVVFRGSADIMRYLIRAAALADCTGKRTFVVSGEKNRQQLHEQQNNLFKDRTFADLWDDRRTYLASQRNAAAITMMLAMGVRTWEDLECGVLLSENCLAIQLELVAETGFGLRETVEALAS